MLPDHHIFHLATVPRRAALVLACALAAAGCTLVAHTEVETPPAPSHVADLPKVPWEGGPEYWERFPRTADAGWTDPTFFPVAVWHSGISNDGEVAWDKEMGVNTYIALADSTPYRLFSDNDVYWIGGALNDTFAPDARNWAGYFLDDEVDGRFPPEEGLDHLLKLRKQWPADRMAYANFTQMVVAQDIEDRHAEAYVNGFTDAISVDMYWYTVPFCDTKPYRANYVVPVEQESCRTSSSYGSVVEGLRRRDSVDGDLQALWQFVELLNGGPGGGPFVRYITPDEVEGAVMNSLIHEARGIVYFNQSFSGPCQAGNVMRAAQVDSGFCGLAQVQAAGRINGLIHDLAPVLNTQSLVFDVGKGIDTMVKVHADNLYIFAMPDGSSPPGTRTLTLPVGVQDSDVEVLYENRTVAVDGRRFADDFAAEHDYHVYRIPIAAADAR